MLIATTYLSRFAYSAFTYFFAIVLFAPFGTYKCNRKIAIGGLLFTAVACGAIFAGFCEIRGLSMFLETIYWFVSSIPLFVVQKHLTKDSFMRDCILLFTQANAVMFIVTLTYYGAVQFFRKVLLESFIVSGILYTVVAVSYRFIFRGVYKRMVAATDPQKRIGLWNLYLIIPCTFLLLQMMLVSIDDLSHSKHYCLVVLSAALSMFLVYVALFFTFRIFEEKQKIVEQNAQLSTQNAMWLRQLEQNEKAVENTRRARHDLRHHDAMLLTLLDSKNYEEAYKYLSEHMRTIEELQPVVFCANGGINSILRSISESAKSAGVAITITACVGNDFQADLVDMCGLFFNLAENAINECKKLPKERRALAINASCEGNRLALSVVNPCAGEVAMVDGHPIRKGNAKGGVGTRSVMGIVERYHGIINYEYADGQFSANAVIFGR